MDKKKPCPRCGAEGTGPYSRYVLNTRKHRYEPYQYFAHKDGPHQSPQLSKQETPNLEKRMNAVLEALQIPLRVVWLPSKESKEHSRIILEEGLIMLHDRDEDEAWKSLFHEILEYRFRSLISPYRELVNKLIEVVERITYKEKERVLEQVMNDFFMWKSLKAETQGSTNQST